MPQSKQNNKAKIAKADGSSYKIGFVGKMPIGMVARDIYQPRRQENPKLDIVQKSIETNGQNMPIVIAAADKDLDAKAGRPFVIVGGGNTRHQACERIGEREVLVRIVEHPGEIGAVLASMDENAARGDLSFGDNAMALGRAFEAWLKKNPESVKKDFINHIDGKAGCGETLAYQALQAYEIFSTQPAGVPTEMTRAMAGILGKKWNNTFTVISELFEHDKNDKGFAKIILNNWIGSKKIMDELKNSNDGACPISVLEMEKLSEGKRGDKLAQVLLAGPLKSYGEGWEKSGKEIFKECLKSFLEDALYYETIKVKKGETIKQFIAAFKGNMKAYGRREKSPSTGDSQKLSLVKGKSKQQQIRCKEFNLLKRDSVLLADKIPDMARDLLTAYHHDLSLKIYKDHLSKWHSLLPKLLKSGRASTKLDLTQMWWSLFGRADEPLMQDFLSDNSEACKNLRRWLFSTTLGETDHKNEEDSKLALVVLLGGFAAKRHFSDGEGRPYRGQWGSLADFVLTVELGNHGSFERQIGLYPVAGKNAVMWCSAVLDIYGNYKLTTAGQGRMKDDLSLHPTPQKALGDLFAVVGVPIRYHDGADSKVVKATYVKGLEKVRDMMEDKSGAIVKALDTLEKNIQKWRKGTAPK